MSGLCWYCYITVTVSKEYQGKGLGDILIEDLINRVKSVKCAYVSLEVRVSNTKAFNLYKKYGFKQVAVRKKYYNDGEDAYAMVKYFEGGEDYEETYIGNWNQLWWNKCSNNWRWR